MPRKLLFAVLLLLCFTACAKAAPPELNFADADVRCALTSLAKAGNFNLVLDDSVKGTISLHLKNLTEKQAVEAIARSKGLFCQQSDGVVYIGAPAEQSLHKFKISHLPAEQVLKSLEKVFADESKINFGILPSSSTIFCYADEKKAAQVKKLLQKLDRPPRQIHLEAKILSLQNEAAKKLGIDWKYGTLTDSGASTGDFPASIKFGSTALPYLSSLQALIESGQAKILARPNITALNGQPAHISIGSSVPIAKTASNNNSLTTSYEYHDAGIILSYTPQINDDGFITAKVHTEVSSPEYVEELKAYRFQKRSADTTVRLKDGETLVIGGLIGSEQSRHLAKVPLLGDIPLLGSLFRSDSAKENSSEIIIFLTAQIKKYIMDKEN